MRFSLILLFSIGATLGADSARPTVVETQSARITISTHKVGQYEVGAMQSIILFYARVDNTSHEVLDIDPTRFFLKTPAGKALRCLSADEATQALLGQTARMRSVLGMGMNGGESGRQMIRAEEQRSSATIRQRMLAPGPIPLSSFREGVVYCEGSGDKRRPPNTLFLVGLVDDPIALDW